MIIRLASLLVALAVLAAPSAAKGQPRDKLPRVGVLEPTRAGGLRDLGYIEGQTPRLMELALRHRLPTISGWRRYAEAGSLIADGAYIPDVCRRSVGYVDKILKGAKPGDLPVQRPQQFELVINLKTARALGLKMPQSLLQQADQMIE